MSGIQQGLLASFGAKKDLEFVGGAALSVSATQTPSYSLTSLTGGLASSPSSGDLVIAAICFRDNTDRNITCTTSGYTEVADLFINGTGNADTNFAVYYKVLSSAETTIAFNLGISRASSLALHVWRNPNSTPLDATTTTATGDAIDPDAPSITTVTGNAVVIAVTGLTVDEGSLSSLSVPSGMENFFTIGTGLVRGVGIASVLRTTAGAYNPPAFGYGGNEADISFCAATLAIRPQ